MTERQAGVEEVPPGYKRTEVGVIPEDWEAIPLRDDISLLSGHHVLARHCNIHGDGVPYLTGPADFPDGHIQQTKFTTHPTTLCREGDILVTVKGSGSGSLIEADASYCISRQLMAIRVKQWNSKFLYYSLLQNANQIKAASTGLIPGLSRSDILDQRIPLPPTVTEQHAIAAALSDVDRLIGALDALIAKKRAIKQAAMQQLLTGKTRLPGFSGDWDTTRIDEHTRIQTGGKNTQDRTEDGKYPFFVRSQEIERINSYTYDCEAVLTAGDGVGTGKVFHYINGRFDVHQRVYVIHDFSQHLHGRYFFYQFSSRFYDRIMSMTAKSSVDSVRMEMIAGMQIPLPSYREQRAIATVLSDMDAELAALERRREKVEQIKQGMMQQLLTGRIRLPSVGRVSA